MGDAAGIVTPVGGPVTGDGITRKRSDPEIDSQEAIQEDEQRQKRARGRPRLDTKDETAADVSLANSWSMSYNNLLMPATASTYPDSLGPESIPSQKRHGHNDVGAKGPGSGKHEFRHEQGIPQILRPRHGRGTTGVVITARW